MLNLNEVTICGCLGRDPDLKYTASTHQAFVSLSVATNRSRKNADGQYEKLTDWHLVVVWGKSAETISEYLRKGDPIWIRGHLETRKYTDKNGVERTATEIICDRFQFVGGKDRSEAPAPQQATERPAKPQGQQRRMSGVPPQGYYDEGDVPF